MDTLLLSASWEPLESVGWQRAMTLWVSGRVEVLEHYRDRTVRTPSTEFLLPAVVRFLRGRRRRSPAVRFSRDNVYLRDSGRCQYCGMSLTRSLATYDHVIPRSRGGATSWENLVVACIPCNQRKGSRTPEEAGFKLLTRPQRPRALPELLRTSITMRSAMPPMWGPYLGIAEVGTGTD